MRTTDVAPCLLAVAGAARAETVDVSDEASGVTHFIQARRQAALRGERPVRIRHSDRPGREQGDHHEPGVGQAVGHGGRAVRRLLLALLLCACPIAQSAELRVCADPNNLPFSNAAGEGFENRIVALLARDLGEVVRYTWWPQRRGNVRNTLAAGTCDLIPGTATSAGMTGTTDPYYRSTYVFVSGADRHLADLASLDDPRLHRLRIGVQLIGDDGANTPPAQSLSRRGIVDNVRGYMVYGDYADPTPQAAIIDAVADGSIDMAIVWGPTAGYFAAKAAVPMVVTPVTPWLDGPQAPMVFDISMGVRRDDHDLRRTINQALARNRPAIDAILADYHVPLVPQPAASPAVPAQR